MGVPCEMYGWLSFSLGLLWLVIMRVNGQQIGVSLVLLGQTIPNNSLVNLDELLYRTDAQQPTNANGLQTLMCITDLVDCCETEGLGNWYYPDGSRIGSTLYYFQANRGQNEVINGQQFYGSVRLWRRYTPPQRGLFRCEIPDANNDIQSLYVTILFFSYTSFTYLDFVAISQSGSTTAGETYSLTCSATLHSRNPPIPDPNIPSPTFEWFFGPNGNASLPSGLTPTPTVLNSVTYTSTLHISPLSESHAGNYTCRLGAGRLVNSAVVTVNASYSIVITGSILGTPTTGAAYSLDCSVNEITDPVTYQWFKGPASSGVQLTNTSQFQFSPLRASDAGLYTCRVNMGGVVTEEATTVTVSLSASTSVMVTHPVVPIIIGSSINLTCTVELSPLVDVPVTVNTVWTGPDGFMTTNTAAQSVRGNTTTYASTAMVSSSGGEQSGNYTCKATVRAMSSYIIDSVGYSSSKIVVVPEPIVSVHSTSPNQIFTAGYPPTLMCTVEMRSVVNIPLSMMIVWKGPDGTAVTPSVKPEMKSFTLYTSSSSLTSVESADSAGEYTCTVSFENGVVMSASTNITIVDGVFQLRLKSVDICQKTSNQPKQYSNFIKEALVKAIEYHCKCYFPTVNILNKDLFICEDSPNLVIYRNALLGTLNFNGTQIIGFIRDWVNTGPLIEIDGNSVRADSSCPTAISSLDDPMCGETEECMADVDPKVARCAEHLDNDSIANCFEGCVVRNG